MSKSALIIEPLETGEFAALRAAQSQEEVAMTSTIETLTDLATYHPAYKRILVAMHEALNGADSPYELNYRIVEIRGYVENPESGKAISTTLLFPEGVDGVWLSFTVCDGKFNYRLSAVTEGMMRVPNSMSGWILAVKGDICKTKQQTDDPLGIAVACYYDTVTRSGFVVMPRLMKKKLQLLR